MHREILTFDLLRNLQNLSSSPFQGLEASMVVCESFKVTKTSGTMMKKVFSVISYFTADSYNTCHVSAGLWRDCDLDDSRI